MVRNYQRKTERAEVPQELYTTAMQEVDSGKTIRQAAKDHGLCHVSLHRRLKKREQGEAPCMGYSKHAQVFGQHQEQELARYVTWSAELRYDLTPVEVRQLAYQCGEKFAIRMPPSWSENRQAGEDWFSGFRERYQFSLRKAENTSLGRAIGFNKPAVDLFFDNLENVLSRQNFGPHQIYNVDETGMSKVPKSSKVVAKTGTRSVGRVVSAERGTLVTLVCAINAIGNSVPPMFIFPRKTYRDHFIRGGPPGSIGRANGSGWIKEEDWHSYVEHFIKFTRPSQDSPILLISDNHVSHLSIPAIDLCREHNITLLSLPPHCSYKLQPLDRVVYGPLKTYVTSRCHAWTRENPEKSLSIYDIPGIAGSELPRATTQHNLIESFRCTGIWPMNRHVFTDRDFAASLVTERPLIPSGSSSDPSGPPAAPGPSAPPAAPGPSAHHLLPQDQVAHMLPQDRVAHHFLPQVRVAHHLLPQDRVAHLLPKVRVAHLLPQFQVVCQLSQVQVACLVPQDQVVCLLAHQHQLLPPRQDVRPARALSPQSWLCPFLKQLGQLIMAMVTTDAGGKVPS